ncbi:DoxX family membrane protein [Nocardioides panaciterrulae]|uniref:Putative membrane protein YphA (DoxX/SURF4 family) n=1 Tax=Nocardioides panaciterrulae TaxID=661492 RepID=A0A7Y9E576_9ACTN|nr:DoxX family membrane protein [Nocardioides panaciterrulae]NYD41202.1 putative membrane protein YphA (DoxX/SURF4 family) [Nocardioides panaciterrulae]
MTLSRTIARPMLASMFVVGGVNALRNATMLAGKAGPITEKVVPMARKAVPQLPIPEDPVTLVRINAVAQLGAAAALATGRAPRLSALVLAASLVPTTAAGHRFWEVEDKGDRAQQQLHFFKNVSMLGGLIIAAGDTDGKPGVAWRARRAARDARREGRHFAQSARREAKLAKAKVG